MKAYSWIHPIAISYKIPFAEGGGCNFRFLNDYRNRKKSYIFITARINQAQINIDGKDLMLTLISRNEPKQELKVGNRYSELYQVEKTRVRIDSVVKQVCDPRDENCEVVVEAATITVHHNGRSRKVNAIGLCGS